MNILEHSKQLKEEFEGFFIGIVEDTADPQNNKRVKVRVKGVFNSPIKIEHLPWAVQLSSHSVPRKGDHVIVTFLGGDIYRPVYIVPQYLGEFDKEDQETDLNTILSNKDSIRQTGVDAGSSQIIDEPVINTSGIETNSRYWRTHKSIEESSSKVILEEFDLTDGAERWGVNHPTGSFVDINKDGDIVIHATGEKYEVNAGENHVILGDEKKNVSGTIYIKIGTGPTATVLKIEGNKITYDSQEFLITGGPGSKLQHDGIVLPTASGPFCGLPNCLFTGAPQTGNVSTKA